MNDRTNHYPPLQHLINSGAVVITDPRRVQLVALFDKLDERGKTTTLAMLAVAVKLHPNGE